MTVAAVACAALEIPEWCESPEPATDLDILPAISTHSGHGDYQKRKATAAICPNGNGRTIQIQMSNGNTRYIPDRCDKWSCEYCSRIKSRIIAGRLHERICKYPLHMIKGLVLTVSTSTMTLEEAEKTITAEWNKLKAAMDRLYGKFPFFWIKDHTQAGYIHLHLLVIIAGEVYQDHLEKHYSIGTVTVAMAGSTMDKLRRHINYLIKRLRESTIKSGKRYGSSRNFLAPKKKYSSNARVNTRTALPPCKIKGVGHRTMQGSLHSHSWCRRGLSYSMG